MRFKNFLTEVGQGYDPSFDEAKFQKDCKFYFQQMKNSKSALLLHGTDAPVIPGRRVEFKPRGKPRDSKRALHDGANDILERRFGRPFRDGLFVSGKESIARSFGRNTAIIIPIGRFEWLSSPDIRDMTTLYDSMYDKVLDAHTGGDDDDDGWDSDVSSQRINSEALEMTLQKLESAKWFHNKTLPKCVAGLNETMLWCPEGFYTFNRLNLPRSVLE